METIILLAPLLGALVCGFGWRIIGEFSGQVLTTGLLSLSALLSWVVFMTHDGTTETITLLRWIDSGSLVADWAIRMDRLTAIMLIVITTVSALVHLYSFGYMAHDENFKDSEPYRARFFAYLSFFTFAMLMLVTADNLVQLFFGWEGVGVASYLLIGFYFKKPSAGAAAMKAFIVNRVGDFGFLLGIATLFFLVDSVAFTDIFERAPEIAEMQISFLWRDWNAAEVVAFLLFIGAAGKSAQLFLHTWLPDAMEGPTPVSALIHAATMVTAGVFLVCRMSPIMEFAPNAMLIVAYIGGFTALFAASVGLVQNDIKRVIAYSTCSQLGYMFAAAGVGAYPLAMFHLLTHAFFKALLFLCAGSVIHGMHHEQDMRNYGGLRHKMPYTFWAMMIGTFAITGVGIPMSLQWFGVPIGLAGFVSKDAIVEAVYAAREGYGTGVFVLLIVAAVMTAFYNWRTIFLTFYGTPRGNKHTHEHAHESPRTMLIPLGVLSFGAIFSGIVFVKPFFGDDHEIRAFFGIPYVIEEKHATSTALPLAAHAAGDDSHTTLAAGDTHGDEGGHGDEADHGDGHTGGHGAQPVQQPGEGAIYFAPDNHVIHDAHYSPWWVTTAPFWAMLLGFYMAFVMYIRRPDLPAKLAQNQRPLYLFLLNKWYFDEIYNAVIVAPTRSLGGFLWKRGDGNVIDGGINGLALAVIPFFTRLAGRFQSGYIFHYAFAMVLGIVLIVMYLMLAGA
ncbi:MAG: NADH-quinone oxidoreductase subunit L [Pseudomonadota bacterium]